ncbi:hypothetical protein DVH24_007987 [Malus domestica]|uniref:Uncharacterized protein n=1 Tax=Malus domestica TaxID=3750 RepID=A0A498JKW3_MALDO|nr:hypothetical protein DVH24_007987 [Malus domestica]
MKGLRIEAYNPGVKAVSHQHLQVILVNLRFSIILKNEATELPTHVVHMLPFNKNLDGMNEKLTAGGKSAKKISLRSSLEEAKRLERQAPFLVQRSLPIYSMNCFLLPKTLCEDLQLRTLDGLIGSLGRVCVARRIKVVLGSARSMILISTSLPN